MDYLKAGSCSWDSVINEIIDDDKNKYDLTRVNSRDLRMCDETGRVSIRGKSDDFVLSYNAASQFCFKYKIPYDFYRKHLDTTDKSYIFNKFVKANESVDLFLRCRDFGSDEPQYIRAVLDSKSFRPLDNRYVLEQLEKIKINRPEYIVSNFALDDLTMIFRMYDQSRPVEIDPVESDIWYGGMHVNNSEVGKRNLGVDGYLFRLVCSNGLIAYDKQKHFLDLHHTNKAHQEFLVRYGDAVWNAMEFSDKMVRMVDKSRNNVIKDVDMFNNNLRDDFIKIDMKVVDDISDEMYELKTPNAYDAVNIMTHKAQELNWDKRYRLERYAGRIMMDVLRAA